VSLAKKYLRKVVFCVDSVVTSAERIAPLNGDRNNSLWINPLLNQLKLVREPEKTASAQSAWNRIESAQLSDRIGKVAAEINEAAGYHLLETLHFLPPQRNVLAVRFDRNRAKHLMAVGIRDGEIRLKFSTSKDLLFGLERYILSEPPKRNWTLVWEQEIQPEKVLEEHIQGWVTYLLSELNKEFRPDTPTPNTARAESNLTAMLRKVSA
jgi:hypothetical protein